MNMLRVTKLDEVWAKVDCEPGQCQEISDLLTFDVPQARFMPSYQKKYWDGKVRLYNARKSIIYTGLYNKMAEFASNNGYEIEIDPELYQSDEISLAEASEFAKSLNLPLRFVTISFVRFVLQLGIVVRY